MKNLKALIAVLALVVVTAAGALTLSVVGSGARQSKTYADGYVLVGSEKYSESGELVPEGSVSQVRFNGGTRVRPVYPSRVEIKGADAGKTVVDAASYLYYSDSSLSSFADGVVLQIAEDGATAPMYYNVPALVLLRKANSGYLLDNSGTPITLTNFIWKVSDETFLMAGDNLVAHLNEEDSINFEKSVRVTYVDDGVVEFTDASGVWYSISEACSVTFGETIAVDLNARTITYGDATVTVPLESMVIGASENTQIQDTSTVGVIPTFEITTIDGEDGEQGEQGKEGSDGVGGNDGSSGASGTQGGTAGGGSTGAAISIPKFNISDWELSPSTASGTINIVDDDGLLISDVVLELREGGNETPIASENIAYGLYTYNFSFDTLQSGAEYRLTATASYSIGAKTYVREFVNKAFRTDEIGVALVKDLVQTNEITFALRVDSYSKVSAAQVELTNPDGTFNSRATVDLAIGSVRFVGLEPDSEYTARLVDVVYDSSLTIPEHGEPCVVKTLKPTPNIGTLQVLVNQKNATFEAMLTNAALLDKNSGVEKFVYSIFDANDVLVKQITSPTSDSVAFVVDNVDTLFRQTPYYVEVAAHFFDNEKTVLLSARSPMLSMSGTQYPSVRFVADEIKHESIAGTIYIDLYQSLLDVGQARPLHITYRNSLGDAITITYTSSDTWTRTGTVCSIPFDVNNLRKDDTYTVSVYGHIDLNDGKGYIYQYLGSVVLDTANPLPVTAIMSVNAADVNHAISVLLSFTDYESEDDNAFEMSTSETLVLSLYEGDDTTGAPVASTNLYDTNDNPYQSDFSDGYYNTGNVITINEETFGVALSDLTATSYTVKLASISDYTVYENSLPIVGGAISLRKTESAPPLPSNVLDALNVIRIDNGSLANYGQARNPAYLNGTAMGFSVRAKYDNGNKKAVSFTYAVYDSTEYASGNTAPAATFTLPVAQSGVYYGTVPTLNLIMGSGVDYWNAENTVYTVFTDNIAYNTAGGVNELARGRDYYFTYTAELKLNDSHGENGNPYYHYPADYQANVVLRSILVPAPFEEASINLYPYSSDANTSTWMARVYDPDATLTVDGTAGAPLFVCAQTAERCAIPIVADRAYNAVTFTDLTAGVYTVSVKSNLYIYPEREQNEVLLNYYFEGVSAYQYAPVTYSLVDQPDLNRIMLLLTSTENNLQKTAGVKFEAWIAGNAASRVTLYSEFDDVTLSGASSTATAYISYADLASLSGNTVVINVSGLCDTGAAGFSYASMTSPFAVQRLRVTEAPPIYKVVHDVTQTMYDLEHANGSMFFGGFSVAGGSASFEYSSPLYPNSQTLNMMLTRTGSRIGSSFEFLTLKRLSNILLNCQTIGVTPHTGSDPTLFLGSILPTVNLMGQDGWRVTNHIDNAEVSLTLNGHQTGSIADGKIYLELYDAGNVHVRDYPIDVNASQTEYSTVIDGLEPGRSYRFMIYANVSSGGSAAKAYLFDAYYQRSTGVTYRINTLGNFESSIDSITVSANSYESKTIDIDFTLGEVVGYKLFFNVYKVDVDEEENETQTLWLSHDAMLYYGLIPSFVNYSETMNAAIRWNPSDYALLAASEMEHSNPLITGQTYQMRITAYAPDNTGEYTIRLSEAFENFTLDERLSPIFGTTVLPDMDSEGHHTLTFTVTTIDTDRTVVGGLYRVKFFDGLGTDITPEIYRAGVGNIPVSYSTDGVYSFVLSPDTVPAGVTLNEASSYTMRFYATVDSQNDGLDAGLAPLSAIDTVAYEDLLAPVFSVSETTLDNSGIKLGNVSVAAGASQGRMRLFFNNSVNLVNVKSIRYSVYSSSGHITFPLVTENFIPVQRSNASGAYYTFDLSRVALSTSDTYHIIAYFYNAAGERIATLQLSYNF